MRFNPSEVQGVGREASSVFFAAPPGLSSSPMNTVSAVRPRDAGGRMPESSPWQEAAGVEAVEVDLELTANMGLIVRMVVERHAVDLHRTVVPGRVRKGRRSRETGERHASGEGYRPAGPAASRATCMNSPEIPCQRPPVWPLMPQQRNSGRPVTMVMAESVDPR